VEIPETALGFRLKAKEEYKSNNNNNNKQSRTLMICFDPENPC
jgi:hypothetical protein